VGKGAIETTALALVALMLGAGVARAKGGVEQITVVGPEWDHTLEIQDSEILVKFNPWGGLLLFLGGQGLRLDEVEVGRSLDGPYQVRFFEGVMGWEYEFAFYRDEREAAGYLLLPEPDPSQGFVLPGGWYQSSDEWNKVLSEQLGRVMMPSKPDETREWILPLWSSFLAVVMVGVVVIVRRTGPLHHEAVPTDNTHREP